MKRAFDTRKSGINYEKPGSRNEAVFFIGNFMKRLRNRTALYIQYLIFNYQMSLDPWNY